MRKYAAFIKNSLLAWVLLFVPACQGQTPANQTKDEPGSARIISPPPQLVRTQGTPSGVVRGELLARDGTLWFSINGEGAYRYDGKSFTNFTTKDGLCDNRVGAIIQDRFGGILLGTERGICRYDGKGFTKFPVPDTLSITCLLEDKDHNLWFGTKGDGIYRYDGKTLANFLNNGDHKFNLGNSHQLVLDILQDRKGHLWFSSWNGGGVWRYDGRAFKNFLPGADYYKANQDKRHPDQSQNAFGYIPPSSYSPSPGFITDDMIYSMTEDRAGNIWFATRDHGACRYDGQVFTTFGKREGFTSRGAYAILEDRKGHFWFTTEKDGVWRYDGKTIQNLGEKDGLVNQAVMNVLEDKAGNLWFGTKGFGLSRYDGKAFTTFSK